MTRPDEHDIDASGTAIPSARPILSVVKDALTGPTDAPARPNAPPRAFSLADIPDDLEAW